MVLQKIIQIPVVNKIYKPVPQEKVVDVYKEVIVEKIVEVPEEEIVPRDVNLTVKAGVVRVNEMTNQMELNTRVIRSHLNPRQVAEFEATSRQLADFTAENEAIKAQITALQERLALTPPERIAAAQNDQQLLYKEIQRMREMLMQQTRERDMIRTEVSRPQEVELTEHVDSTAVDSLMHDIELVKSKNLQLRDYLENVRKVAHKNSVSRAEAHRPRTAFSLAKTSEIKVSGAGYASHIGLSTSPGGRMGHAVTHHTTTHHATSHVHSTVNHLSRSPTPTRGGIVAGVTRSPVLG